MNRKRTTTPDGMPILSSGRHRNAARGACFMEYASYLAGERWSDHPACTHPQLAELARDVNDLTTDAGRAQLVPLVHRVVGLTPLDARFAGEIAVLAACAALPIVSLERQRALGVGLLAMIARLGDSRLDALAREAFAQAPDVERWARGYFAIAPESHGSVARAANAMIHTATVGMALACVAEPDSHLLSLLARAIEAGEAAASREATPEGATTEERVLVAG